MQDTTMETDVRLSPPIPDLSAMKEEPGLEDDDRPEPRTSPTATDTEEDQGSGSSSGEDRSGGLRCSVCPALLDTQHDLTLHIRGHNEDSATVCRVCGKVLGSASSLDRHVLVHSGERPFSCTLCGVRFTTNGNMHRHMRSHEEVQTGTLGESRKRKMEYNNNNNGEEGVVVKRKGQSKRKASKQGRFGCPKCEKGFVSLHVLEIHLEEEHPEYSASCLDCNLVFKNYRVLNLHRFMVHYSEEDQARDLSLVDFSSEKFPLIARAMLEGPKAEPQAPLDDPPSSPDQPGGDKNNFLAHLDLRKSPDKTQENSTPESNPRSTPPTPVEGSPSPRPSEAEEEQDCFSAEFRKMKLRGEFPCRLCGSVFPNLRALKGHNRVHLGAGQEPYQCNLCLFTSRERAAVVRHMRTHNGDRPYECGLCNYAFTTKANCERHLRNRHNASRTDLKNSIIYHPSEDPTNDGSPGSGASPGGGCREEAKRMLFGEAETDTKREVGTMTIDGPLDLSMDALDLTVKKRPKDDDEAVKAPRAPPPPHILSGFHFFSRFPPFPATPYFVPPPPPPPPPPGFMVTNDNLKERLQEELIRTLSLSQGLAVHQALKGGPVEGTPPPAREVRASQAPSDAGGVKMVIKNGVLVPKQKQRRYRTERPFACEHCTARFTLRSNMERHVKQQHPQFWSTRQRNSAPGRKSTNRGAQPSAPVQPAAEEPPRRADEAREKISEGVRLAIVEQLKSKVVQQQQHQQPAEEQGRKGDQDLASVSKLLDNASTQTFRQYFGSQEEQSGSGASDEEGLVASHSEDNSGSDENKSGEAARVKKVSAYSLAPHRVSCPYCRRKFPWSSSLRRHILTHTGQKPFKCPSCPLLFTTKSNCDRHLLRKHGGSPGSSVAESAPPQDQARTVPERPYRCHRCPSSTFSTLGNLKKHRCSKHDSPRGDSDGGSPGGGSGSGEGESAPGSGLPPELPFKCHLCEGAFGERQEALAHLGRAHPAEYQALASKGALESSAEDEDGHTDTTNKFTDYANRKVMCAFCLRRFWSAEDLRRHMRTHTGERPFSCDVCTRKFTLKHSMLRHRKKHGGASSARTPALEIKTEETTQARPPALEIKTEESTQARPQDEGEEEQQPDLICNLLGIGDRRVVDKMLERPADQAAELLGVRGGE